MSRPVPTDAEKDLGKRFEKFILATEGSFTSVSREQSDRPDMLFDVKGSRVACELTQIPPANVLRWAYKHFEEARNGSYDGHQIIWAEEPHAWVADAILRKRQKIVEYKKITGAARVWLLIHTPLEDTQVFVRGDFPWEAQMLRYGAGQESHGFDRIYFWEPRSGFQLIYRKNLRRTPRVTFDYSRGYPTRSFRIWSLPFETTAVGAPPVDYEHGELIFKNIVVPPIDPEFRKHKPRMPSFRYKMKIRAHSDQIEWSLVPVEQ